jgi:hypothetical protein
MRWVLVGTAAVWVVLELRQSLTRRPEAVKASWRSEVLFRFIVGVGAVVAGVLAGMVKSATIRPAPVADGIGFALFWAGIPRGFGAFTLWGGTSLLPSRRAVISR